MKAKHRGGDMTDVRVNARVFARTQAFQVSLRIVESAICEFGKVTTCKFTVKTSWADYG